MRALKQGPSSHSRSIRQKRRKEVDVAAVDKPKDDHTTGDTIVVKPARSVQSKVTPLAPIQCTACKKTDVPLILGGSEYYSRRITFSHSRNRILSSLCRGRETKDKCSSNDAHGACIEFSAVRSTVYYYKIAWRSCFVSRHPTIT
jgi:hypothetical protein